MPRITKSVLCIGLLALVYLILPSSARADSNFTWSYTCDTAGCTDNASGTLTTGGFVGGVASILSIAGTYDGSAITGLLPTGTCCAADLNNNLLYFPGTPYLDEAGLGLAVGSLDVNLFFFDGTYGDDTCISGSNCSSDYTRVSSGVFTVAAVQTPEPSGVLMLVVGLAGLISLGCKRRAGRAQLG